MLPQDELRKLLIPVLKKENEEIEKTFSERHNYYAWKDVDKSHQEFLRALDSGDINKARKFIEKKKAQLDFFYKRLCDLYKVIENIHIEENKIPENEMEVLKIWSYQERRKSKIRNALRRIEEYKERVEGLKEELNSNNVEDLLRWGTLLHLFIDRASNVITMVNASSSQVCNILGLSTNEKEYSRQINGNKAKIISTLTRYVSSLEMSKHFFHIALPTGEKVGIHGEYDKDCRGESELIVALNQILNPILPPLDEDLRNIRNKIEEVAKDRGLDKEATRRIMNKFKPTELLWDLYGLSGIENICVEVEKIEAVAENRVQALKVLYQKGKCHAIPEFQIICEVEPHAIEIADVIIRFMSEKFGKETTLENEINKAEQWYKSKYEPCLFNIASALYKLRYYVEKYIKEGKIVNPKNLEEAYRQLKSNINELFSPGGMILITESDKPNYLIRKELRSSLRKIGKWVQTYRDTFQYSPEIEEPINTLIEYADKANQRLGGPKEINENPLLV